MAAIYMWISGEVMYLSTTLYPIEVVDALQLGVSLGNGSMSPVPGEMFDTVEILVSGQLRQVLKVTGPYFEALDTTESLVSASLPVILKILDPKYEALDTIERLVNAYLSLALVTGDTPDEALEFVCQLDTGFCSLTPV